MIISNAVPKAGGHLLFAYLRACGLEREPGELYADVDVSRSYPVTRRPLSQSMKDIWHGFVLRPPDEILADRASANVVNAHVHDGIDLSGHRVVFMYRHPRNILISDARFQAVQFNWTPPRDEPSADAVRKLLDKHNIARTIARCECFAGWLDKAEVSVGFEDFVAGHVDVAGALGIAGPAEFTGAQAAWITPTYRGTYSGRHSDWRDFWDKRLESAWDSAGGPRVEELYGYGG